MELSRVFRQSDLDFISNLDVMRKGQVQSHHIKWFNDT